MTNPIDYSSRDYASLLQDMIANAALLMPEWTNITSPTDFGAVLLELFAYMGDISNYYIDRIANEALLSTAQRRQSVLNIAAMFNYTPVTTTPATGSIKITLLNGSLTTTIPAGTQVATTPSIGNDPVVFETIADLVINGSDAVIPVNTNANGSVGAVQGVTVTNEILTDNSDGSPGASYTLYNPSVIDGSISITVTSLVGSTLWRNIDNLLTITAAEQVYVTSVDENNVTTVTFGDGVFGAIPPPGTTISATYRIGGGTVGNVVSGTVVELVNPISAVVSVTNVGAMVGGTDPESIASMRSTIPKSLSTLHRAVTLNDYEALAVQVPGIAKASASANVYTSVLLNLAPIGGSPSNPVVTGAANTPGTQKYAVDQYLSDKKLVNVFISYGDPTWTSVSVSASVNLLASYYQPTVRDAITVALGELFLFDNVDFGQTLTISQVYHAIQAVPGVDYSTLTKLVRTAAATPSGVQNITCTSVEIPYLGPVTLALVGGVS